jgi:hypothetical protein
MFVAKLNLYPKKLSPGSGLSPKAPSYSTPTEKLERIAQVARQTPNHEWDMSDWLIEKEGYLVGCAIGNALLKTPEFQGITLKKRLDAQTHEPRLLRGYRGSSWRDLAKWLGISYRDTLYLFDTDEYDVEPTQTVVVQRIRDYIARGLKSQSTLLP